MKSSAAIVMIAALLASGTAEAQEYMVGVSGEVSDGIEMGTSVPMKVARARIRLGADLRVDEFPKDVLCIGLLADMFPHTEFGFDVRYARMLGTHFEVNIGGIGYVAPSTLFGPSADLKYHLHLSSSADLLLGPELNFFVLGSDLPDGTVFGQVLLEVGVHASL